jgi:enoyl-CoA hydratase
MSTDAPTPALTVTDSGDLRFITFDRPAKLNAVTTVELRAAIRAVREAEDRLRGIVFTGAGTHAFCGGMHLDSFRDLDPGSARELITDVRDFLAAVRTTPLATAAMVNGYCIGVALELALACDLRVSVPDARYGLPEVGIGIPSIADAALLQQHVGLSLAKEMILTGDLYPTGTMDRAGLLNRIVEPAELRGVTVELLGRVTRHTRTVLGAQKRLFETWQNTTLVDGAEASIHEFARVFEAAETRDRVSSAVRR